MTDLEDYASAGVDVVRISEAEGQPYRLEDMELKPAEDVGTEDFPQYGRFLDVTAVDKDGDDLGPRYVETPRSLASELVAEDIEPGDCFVVTSTTKTDDDAWSITAVEWSP